MVDEGSGGLVDYVLLAGLGPSEIHKKSETIAQSDVDTLIRPITGIYLTAATPNSPQLDLNRTGVTPLRSTPTGLSADLNGASMFRKPCFISVTRDSGIMPISELMIRDRSTPSLPGFEELMSLTLRSKHSVLDCKRSWDVVIKSILVISPDKGESCPKDFILLDACLNANVFAVDDLYLCYRVVTINRAAYQPEVLNRFPSTDLAYYPFPSGLVAEFCFPQGLTITPDIELPSFMSFVFTNEKKEEVYGMCLTFYEQLSESQMAAYQSISEEEEPGVLFSQKCITLLSHYPFYENFKVFLVQLYRITMSPSRVPFERYIEQLYFDVPVPLPGQLVKCSIGHSKLLFSMPPRINFPMLDLPLRVLFRCLSLDSILLLFEQLLMEKKVVLYSNHYSILNTVGESLRSLMYPFEWPYTYIPILPTSLSDVLQAPLPLLIGMHRSFIDEIHVGQDLVLVDLDRSLVYIPKNVSMRKVFLHGTEASAYRIPKKLFPEVLRQHFIAELSQFSAVYRENDNSTRINKVSSLHAPNPEDEDLDDPEMYFFNEHGIRVTFFKLFVQIFYNFRDFLSTPNGIYEQKFDYDRFLSELHESAIDYTRRILKSQYWARFLGSFISVEPSNAAIFFAWAISVYADSPEAFHERVMHDVLDTSYHTTGNTVVLDQVSQESEGKSPMILHTTFPNIDTTRFIRTRNLPNFSNNFDFKELFRDDIVGTLNKVHISLSCQLVATSSSLQLGIPISKENIFFKQCVGSILELYFILFQWELGGSCRFLDCRKRTYREFGHIFVILHQMSSAGVPITDRVIEPLCKLAIDKGLFDVFRRLFSLAVRSQDCTSSFLEVIIASEKDAAGFPPSPSYKCTCRDRSRRISLSNLDPSHVPNSSDLPPNSLEYLTRTEALLPTSMYICCVCPNCKYALTGGEVACGWYFLATKPSVAQMLRHVSADSKCPACHSAVPTTLSMNFKKSTRRRMGDDLLGEIQRHSRSPKHAFEEVQEAFASIPSGIDMNRTFSDFDSRSQEIGSYSVPLMRPDLVVRMLKKELAFVVDRTFPMSQIRHNTTLYWNMVYWFGFLKLDFTDLMGFRLDNASVSVDCSLLTPWVWSCNSRDNPRVVVHTPEYPGFSDIPVEVHDELAAAFDDRRVGLAIDILLKHRRLMEATSANGVLHQSMYRLLGLVNLELGSMSHLAFAQKYCTELVNSGSNRREEFITSDQVDSIGVISLALSLSEQARDIQKMEISLLPEYCTELRVLHETYEELPEFVQRTQETRFTHAFPSTSGQVLFKFWNAVNKFKSMDNPDPKVLRTPKERLEEALRIYGMFLDPDAASNDIQAHLLSLVDPADIVLLFESLENHRSILDVETDFSQNYIWNPKDFPPSTLFDLFAKAAETRLCQLYQTNPE